MIHGILNVYKEKGFTSHDVVAKLRGITGQRKIGHTGTLDPDAEGVLPVCLGRATKLCDMLTDRDKTYEAVLLLGRVTDTQDISGEVLETRDTSGLSRESVERAIEGFVGRYDQIPPMYSALKVNGRKLYELAREGKEVERKARTVWIYGIDILEADLPRVRMRVQCSKGTYIRTLCHDIGEKLQCGGCMEELIRTRSGRFSAETSLTLAEIARMSGQGNLTDALIPMDAVFGDCPALTVKKNWETTAKNGNPLPRRAFDGLSGEEGCPQKKVRIYTGDGQFISVCQWQEEKEEYHILKMFYVSE